MEKQGDGFSDSLFFGVIVSLLLVTKIFFKCLTSILFQSLCFVHCSSKVNIITEHFSSE